MNCRTTAIGALACYASTAYVFGTTLKHLPPILLVPMYIGVIFIVALGRLSYEWTAGGYALPTKMIDYVWLIATGVVIYIADILYMKSIAVSLTTTTIFLSMLPVVVAIIKLVLTGELPTWRQCVAAVLVVSAVVVLVYE